jgi:ABC-2 type transport system permease protein
MLNHIAAIAYRDLTKFVRDPMRVISSLIFPVIFVGVMGRTMDANLGESIGFDFQVFIFTGIYAQTLFESSTFGVIWLIEDRENDFSQEIFV